MQRRSVLLSRAKSEARWITTRRVVDIQSLNSCREAIAEQTASKLDAKASYRANNDVYSIALSMSVPYFNSIAVVITIHFFLHCQFSIARVITILSIHSISILTFIIRSSFTSYFASTLHRELSNTCNLSTSLRIAAIHFERPSLGRVYQILPGALWFCPMGCPPRED